TEPPDWSGEQRLVTILVARLVGTEPLVEALDREAAGRAIADVIETMTATVDRWGGTVLGREPAGFVAVFGVPAAREDDTYQALRTALRVVEQADTHGREIQRAWQVDGVGLQAAVTTSHVTLPVDPGALNRGNARLDEVLEQAVPGVVIADEHSRKLMGDLFEWEPIAGTQEAWQVVGIRQRADKARWGRRLHSPLLGRDRELGDLEAALDALNRGIGGVVFLSGEAGVGKTRLLMEARDRSDDRTAWLAGHCAAYAEAHPYWPFRDMFRSWLGVGIDDTDLQVRLALHEKLEAVAGTGADDLYPYLGNLLGIALEPGQDARLQLSSEALRYRTFEVVTTLLALLAESQPTVVVMEDLHWADSTSTQLLEQVLPLCERLAIMLVLTTRPAPDHPTQRLAETARQRHPHRTRDVRLDPLEEDAQRGMLAALVGSDTMPLRMVDKLLSLAEGNPFYLEELVG